MKFLTMGCKCLIFAIISLLVFSPYITNAYVSVKGYYRSNGTYVAPYVRSNPNGLKSDNYGYRPSQGVYNSTYGTRGSAWDTPTYVTDSDYYTGQALYNGGVSSYDYNTNTYTYTPSYSSNSYTVYKDEGCKTNEIVSQGRCVNKYTFCKKTYDTDYFYSSSSGTCVSCPSGYKYNLVTEQCKLK